MFLPQSERPSFAPMQHNQQNYSFVLTYSNIKYDKVADTEMGMLPQKSTWMKFQTALETCNLHAILASMRTGLNHPVTDKLEEAIMGKGAL
jgi:hypothetical protein